MKHIHVYDVCVCVCLSCWRDVVHMSSDLHDDGMRRADKRDGIGLVCVVVFGVLNEYVGWESVFGIVHSTQTVDGDVNVYIDVVIAATLLRGADRRIYVEHIAYRVLS